MPTKYPAELDDNTSLPEPSTGQTIPAAADTNRSQALKEVEKKIGIGASPATSATAGQALVADGTGASSWQSIYKPGGTDVPVADGGTGASTASGARTNLGLAIGTDVQAYDAELAAIAGLTSAADKLPYFSGSATAALTDFTAAARALLDDANAAAMRVTLGLAIGSDVMAYDADLATIAGLTATTDNFIQAKGSEWSSRTPTQVTADLIAFTGDSGSGGVKGLVPAPAAGDGAAGKVLKADGTWGTVSGGGLGDVVGPSSATDNAIARFNSTTGKLLQNSGATIDDSGNITATNLSGTNTGDQDLSTYYHSGGTDVPVADGGTGASTASGARTNLGLAIGTDVQAYDAELAAIAGLTSAADKLPYFTGAGTAALADITSAARSLLDDANVGAMRTTLGLGTVATLDSDTDTTLAANSDSKVATQKAVKTYVDNSVTGLLDFKGATDASTNPNYPAASKGDTYVVSVAGKVGGASGKSVEIGDMYLATADNAGGTEASVGTSWSVLEHNIVGALVASNNLSDLTNAATARTNLGLAIGTDVQAYDAELAAIAGLTSAANKLPYFTGSGTASLADFTAAARSLLDDADATAMRSTLGLVIGTNVQAYDADLATIAGLTATTDTFLQAKASSWTTRTPTQVTADLIAVVGDSGSGGTKGLVPAPAAGDAAAGKFLKADGTWAAPSGGGSSDIFHTLYRIDADSTNTTAPLYKTQDAATVTLNTNGYWEMIGTAFPSDSLAALYWMPSSVSIMNASMYDTKLRFFMVSRTFAGSSNNMEMFFGTIDRNPSAKSVTPFTKTVKHVAFYCEEVSGTRKWYASNANGTTQTTTDITASIADDVFKRFYIDFDGVNDSIKYYVNGSLVATHTTNVPSGGNGSNSTGMVVTMSNTGAIGGGAPYHHLVSAEMQILMNA